MTWIRVLVVLLLLGIGAGAEAQDPSALARLRAQVAEHETELASLDRELSARPDQILDPTQHPVYRETA